METTKGFKFGIGIILAFALVFSVYTIAEKTKTHLEEKEEAEQLQRYIESLPLEVIFEVYQNEDNTKCNVASVDGYFPSKYYGINDISYSLKGDCSEYWYTSRCEVINQSLIKCGNLCSILKLGGLNERRKRIYFKRENKKC